MAQQADDLTVLLPAHNEALVIERVIEGIKVFLPSGKILVVDNGSTDGTYSEALACGVEVIKEEVLGKGQAIRTGLQNIDTPFIIMMNSDWTYPPYHLPIVYKLLQEGADVVIGCRTFKEDGSMTKTNRIGNWALSQLASVLYRYRIQDLCTGMWGFNRKVADALSLTSDGFTLEAELFSHMIKCGYSIKQIPINYRPRVDGSKAKISVWDGFRIGWFLVRRRFT